MNAWFYLSFGFGFLFSWLRKENPRGLGSQEIREIWLETFCLTAAVGTLVLLHGLLTFLIWGPSGRSDLGMVSLFLGAFLIDEGMGRLARRGRGKERIRIVASRSFLDLVGFSLWMVDEGGGSSPPERFLWGLGLPLGMGLFEWLLAGLRERVKLSHLPPVLEGTPILFWLAMLLSLALGGLAGGAASQL